MQNSDVVLAIDRAGIVGGDGVTHQGIFDIAYLQSIPNMVLMAPKDENEFSKMIEFAIKLERPVAVRYPKDKVPKFTIEQESGELELGKSEMLRDGKDVVIIAFGSMVYPSLLAAEDLAKKQIEARVINARFAIPLDEDLLRDLSCNFKNIVTVEEGIIDGGFGGAVLKKISSICRGSEKPEVKIIGLPCEFIQHGSRLLLLERYGLTAEGIARSVKDFLI